MSDVSNNPETMLEPRPQKFGAMATLIAWVIETVPIIAISLIIFAEVVSPDSSALSLGKLVIIVLGVALLFCMIAFPQLLGNAVVHRERGLWRSALITGISTAGAILYIIFRWLANL